MQIQLRPWCINDLENLVKYANNPKIANNLTDAFPHPYTLEDGKVFLEMVTSVNPSTILAIEVDSEVVGSIGVIPQTDVHRKNAEMGYWLAEPFWGKGIMSIAIQKMVEYGFNTFDIDRIFARPFGTNKASQRVLEKAGFTLEAKFEKTLIKNGNIQDEFFYAKRR